MRKLIVLVPLALTALLHAACGGEDTEPADVCAEAKNLFSSCGTSLPLLSDGPCSGPTRIVARCVVDHAADCEELATLFVRIDACLADMLDGGDSLLPPATDLPVPPRDAGHDTRNDGGPGGDAAPRPTDGGSSGHEGRASGDAATEGRP